MVERAGVSLMLQTLASPATGLGTAPRSRSRATTRSRSTPKRAPQGLAPDEPFVGNGLWVAQFRDPDGYSIEFSSSTSVADDTTLSDHQATS